jgi:hypothetical protein
MMKNKYQSTKTNHRKAFNAVIAGILIATMGMIGSSFFPLTAMAQTSLDAETQQAMIDSINDEYRARAFYNAVIEKFGSVRPFTNIVRSENNHVNLWENLFAKYGIAVPADSFAGNVSVPDTLKAACEMGVEAEIDNVAMYDRFLTFVTQSDLQAAFTQLRQVSQEKHLTAFERCVQRSNGGGRGR